MPLYTIGQRRGLGGGGGPYYAAKFDYKRNILYVVKDPNDPIFNFTSLIAKRVNWLSGKSPKRPFPCGAMLRYGAKVVPCTVAPYGKSDYLVKFSQPQRAIAPGQSIVFYDQEKVLGGGIISML